MGILATNKAKNEFHYEHSWAAYQNCMSVIFFGCMIFILCRYGFRLADATLAFLSLTIVLYNMEIYLLNKRATETISVQHETLVLDYHNLIFRHRKEIPLSSITGVEFLDYENRDVWHPYTLRVVHSGRQSYRIGISMTQQDSKTLAGIITELAEQYI